MQSSGGLYVQYVCTRVSVPTGQLSRGVGRHFDRFKFILRLHHRNGSAFQRQTLQNDRHLTLLLTYLLDNITLTCGAALLQLLVFLKLCYLMCIVTF